MNVYTNTATYFDAVVDGDDAVFTMVKTGFSISTRPGGIGRSEEDGWGVRAQRDDLVAAFRADALDRGLTGRKASKDAWAGASASVVEAFRRDVLPGLTTPKERLAAVEALRERGFHIFLANEEIWPTRPQRRPRRRR